jgi:hypothetical protein
MVLSLFSSMNRFLIIFISIWKFLFQFLKFKFTWIFAWISNLLFESENWYFNFDNYYLNLKIDISILIIIIWIWKLIFEIWKSIFQFYNCYLIWKLLFQFFKKYFLCGNLLFDIEKYISILKFILEFWKGFFESKIWYLNFLEAYLSLKFDVWIMKIVNKSYCNQKKGVLFHHLD